jgi:hypothetical protein
MSTRERWIVYPLLFLTLGITLRESYELKHGLPDHLRANQMAANEVRCGKLEVDQLLCGQAEVTQMARARQVVCERVESEQSACRSLFVNGSNGRPVVVAIMDPRNHNGLVEILSANRAPLVQLRSSEGGGMVAAIDQNGKAIIMGNIGKNFGLFAHMPGTGLIIPLTQPWRFEGKGVAPLPSKDQAPPSAPGKKPAEKEEPPRSDGKK